MIRVKLVVLEEKLRRILGEKNMVFNLSEDEATIKKLIEKMAAKYGGEVLKILSNPGVSILLNGQYLEFLGGESAKLSDGDRIAIIPPIVGGGIYFFHLFY